MQIVTWLYGEEAKESPGFLLSHLLGLKEIFSRSFPCKKVRHLFPTKHFVYTCFKIVTFLCCVSVFTLLRKEHKKGTVFLNFGAEATRLKGHGTCL